MTTWVRVGLAKRDMFLVWFGLGERDVWVWLSRDIVFFLGRFVTVSFRALLVVFLWLVREEGGGGLRKVAFIGRGGGGSAGRSLYL